MKPINLFLYCLLLINYSFSQEPSIEWQKTFGGSLQDFSTVSIQTIDGGYLSAGYSLSNTSGDKTENCIGNYDYWIVKMSATGTIEWENTIGGSAEDYLTDAKQTSDGGYLIAGYSRSPVSGDKTTGIIGGVTSTYDFWLIKLFPSGTIEWQKTIGGNGSDVLNSINPTTDGGFILAGYSDSPISGNKTENSLGFYDYWLVKIDNIGNIQWQNTIGGSSSDRLIYAEQTADGGYIAGGYSFSSVSGDKSETNYGSEDYWVVKTDINGNIEWQNSIGGNLSDYLSCIKQTVSGNYIIGGYSLSEAGYDKTENNHNQFFNDADIWLVELSSTGDIINQNTIGSELYEDVCDLALTPDGGFIVGTVSGDEISGDLNELSSGSDDYWIFKLDGNLNMIWQKLIGGSATENLSSVIPTSDNGYLISGYSYSSATGDKTTPLIGVFDYWIIKIEEDNCLPLTLLFGC